ncbi:hypothetical protein GCM10010302_24840 [Streptomyces polychromogenes]|uniref:Uncharacterized protein n=1 Tax=Streptomyces polychromogenes TaxID=67342 RepID=A0ABN0VC98_9ACTN
MTTNTAGPHPPEADPPARRRGCAGDRDRWLGRDFPTEGTPDGGTATGPGRSRAEGRRARHRRQGRNQARPEARSGTPPETGASTGPGAGPGACPAPGVCRGFLTDETPDGGTATAPGQRPAGGPLRHAA